MKKAKTKPKRRVAFVVPSLTLGGAERSLVKAATMLFESGYDVHVVVLSDSAGEIDSELPLPVTVWRCRGGSSANPILWIRVRLRLRRIGAPLVIGWSTYANMVAVVASRPWDTWKLVLSERIYIPELLRTLASASLRRFLMAFLMRALYPLAAVVTANSADNVRFLAKWIRGTASFKQLPNIIDIEQVDCLSMESADPKSRGGGVLILAVGRLVPQKGFDILLRAMAQVPKDLPWHLDLIGEGPEEARLRQLAVEAGIADRINWLGTRANPFPYFQNADIVVVPSRFEGFPNTALEAMASGKALICTDCKTGPRELTGNGQFAVLVPKENVGALAEAITRLARDPEARRALGSKARTHVAGQYSLEAVKKIYINLFDCPD
jgi:GalNAc-alpha-(1->4)-GalNAc-alpha-(1->3)-diNAcBac-PP-undecaprenol alpha-1,4-N-acetyl-D-galactosaminyltransferase